MNNNTVLALGAIIVLIIGVAVVVTVSKDPVGVPATTTPAATSSSQSQVEAEREAAFQAERKAAEEKEVAFKINVSTLPQAQQTALNAVGVSSTSSLSITNKMVSCASTDMSATRVAEIKAGAVVTAGEGIKFVSCYNANN